MNTDTSLKNIFDPLNIDYFLWWLPAYYKRTGWLLFKINFNVNSKSSFVEAVLASTY